jgi:hypothetical protein
MQAYIYIYKRVPLDTTILVFLIFLIYLFCQWKCRISFFLKKILIKYPCTNLSLDSSFTYGDGNMNECCSHHMKFYQVRVFQV